MTGAILTTIGPELDECLRTGDGERAARIAMSVRDAEALPQALAARIVRTLVQLGQVEAATGFADARLRRHGPHPALLTQTGLALHHRGDSAAALRLLDQAVTLAPDDAEARLNHGALLLELDRPADALATTEAGLEAHPGHGGLVLNRVTALVYLDRPGDALAALDAAGDLATAPPFLVNRIQALLGLGRMAEALSVLESLPEEGGERQAVLPLVAEALAEGLDAHGVDRLAADLTAAHAPALFRACLRFASAAIDEGRWTLAARIARDLGRHPAFVGIDDVLKCQRLHVEALALALQQRFREADAVLRQWLQHPRRDPELGRRSAAPGRRAVPYRALLMHAEWHLGRRQRCDWSHLADFERCYPALAHAELALGRCAPLDTHNALQFALPAALQKASAAMEARGVLSAVVPYRDQFGSQPAANRAPGEPLRIGYLSADFRNHATGHLIQGLFERHDRARVTVIGLSLSADDGSPYHRRIRAGCDRFLELQDLHPLEAARRIAGERIHVLVDLMGYTTRSCPEILALGPAPVQVAYLGFPGSLGAPFIPYALVDPVVLPPEDADEFTEAPVYLPDCYQVVAHQAIAETGITRADAGLPERAFVFASFNGQRKLRPETFACWMRILQRVPEGVLWLFVDHPRAPRHLRAEAARAGIDPARLHFCGRMDKPRHLERMRLADLFLDTFLCGAHTTASDALWAGLPLVTLRGHAFQGRVAASILTAAGLPDLIAESVDEYEAIALRLATDRDALSSLRARVAEARHSSRLFDRDRFTRHLERAFELLWQDHAAGIAPRPVHVPPAGT